MKSILIAITILASVNAFSSDGCIQDYERSNIKIKNKVNRMSNGGHIVSALTLQEILLGIGMANNPAVTIAYFTYPVVSRLRVAKYRSQEKVIKLIKESEIGSGETLNNLVSQLRKRKKFVDITVENVSSIISQANKSKALCDGTLLVDEEETENFETDKSLASYGQVKSYVKSQL